MDKTYLFKDFKDFEVTKETKEDILKNPWKYSSCDVRIRMGMFYTDEEKEQYIETSLKRRLPGDNNKKLGFFKRKHK